MCLLFALLQFDNIMTASLAKINKTTDEDGNINYPHLCVTKRPPVVFQEEYTLQLDTRKEYLFNIGQHLP